MANQYEWVGSEQVTVDLAPDLTIESQQVTAVAVKSGVYFVMRFTPDEFKSAEGVHTSLNQLAGRFDSWMAVDGVVSIASVEQVNAAGMLKLGTQVTVQSKTGRSTTVFDYTYPVAEFNTNPAFIEAVNREVAILNAAEGV